MTSTHDTACVCGAYPLIHRDSHIDDSAHVWWYLTCDCGRTSHEFLTKERALADWARLTSTPLEQAA